MATWKKVAFVIECIENDEFTADGDIIYGTGAGALAALGIEDDGDVLTLAAGLPAWDPPAAPVHHADTHKHDGVSDVLLLSDLVAADAVNLNGQECLNIVIHTASTPPAAVLGKPYFDAEDLALYICTVL